MLDDVLSGWLIILYRGCYRAWATYVFGEFLPSRNSFYLRYVDFAAAASTRIETVYLSALIAPQSFYVNRARVLKCINMLFGVCLKSISYRS
jgi:hypothetical protein